MKKSNIIPLYIVTSLVISLSALCTFAVMNDRVDVKYCSDNGSFTYYTVKGTDTTYYNTAFQIADFNSKWVASK